MTGFKTINAGGLILIAVLAGSFISGCGESMSSSASDQQTHKTQSTLRRLILDQPDFVALATLTFSGEKLARELKGLSRSYSVSKKGSVYRADMGVVISYERPNEPKLQFYPRSREYIEDPRLEIWFADAFAPGLAHLDAPNLIVERVGEIELDGWKCTKIQLSNRDDPSTTVTYYVAKGLRNLIIRIELVDLLSTQTCSLRDVSLDVPN